MESEQQEHETWGEDDELRGRDKRIMGAALQRMLSSFYTRQLEVVLVGLENSGKTTLMNG